MSLSGQLLADFSLYGLPVLFGVVLLGSAGLPVPGVVLVIAAGALVQQGDMNLWWVLGLTCSAAILGDSLGYAVGRFAGRSLVCRIVARVDGEDHWQRAEELARRWGGLGIFFSRWLLTPFGAPLNLISGMAEYPYPRFLFFDISGEILWTLSSVLLGEVLSDRLATVVQLAGQVPWVVVGLVGAVIFGRSLVRYLRKPRA